MRHRHSQRWSFDFCGREQFFSCSSYQIQHVAYAVNHTSSWQYLKLLIRVKTFECLGTPWQWEPGGVSWPWQVQCPKPPWDLTQREHRDTLACWNGILSHRQRLQPPDAISSACPPSCAYRKSVTIPTAVSAGKKSQQWAHIQNRKVNCLTSCTAGDKGDWPLLLRTRVIKNIYLKTWKGHLTVHSVKSCQSYKVNM